MSSGEIGQMVGAIATVLVLLLTLFLEWPRMRTRLQESSQVIRLLLRALSGFFVFAVSGFVANTLSILLQTSIGFPEKFPLNFYNNFVYFSWVNSLAWALCGAIFGIFFGVNKSLFFASKRERLVGLFVGMLGGATLSSMSASIVNLYSTVTEWFAIVTSWLFGGAVGGMLIGFLLASYVKKFIYVLYGLSNTIENNVYSQTRNEHRISKNISLANFRDILISSDWVLVYRPPDQFKDISFLPDGTIGDGQNQNEHRWQIQNGRLEILQQDGRVHSRFDFDGKETQLTHTNDLDTLSIRGQIIKLR